MINSIRAILILLVISICQFFVNSVIGAQNIPTKTLLAWCDDYLAGHENQVPGVLCATWFEGWLASYSVGANGLQPNGQSVFNICEPPQFAPDTAIRVFVGVVHAYPSFFEQPHLNDTIFSVPWTLSHTWTCLDKK
jgi:hypothetical protein